MFVGKLFRFKQGFREFTTGGFSQNYYKILGVSPGASKTDIRKAYIDLAKKYHPDTSSGQEEKFKQVAQAYEVLGNESSRSQYDSKMASGRPRHPSSHDFRRAYTRKPHSRYQYRSPFNENYKSERQKMYEEYIKANYGGFSSYERAFAEELRRRQRSRQTEEEPPSFIDALTSSFFFFGIVVMFLVFIRIIKEILKPHRRNTGMPVYSEDFYHTRLVDRKLPRSDSRERI